MALRRGISRRKKRAHVLRNRQRAVLRPSSHSADKEIPYDPSIFRSGSSEDGARAAEAYVYRTQEKNVKKIMTSCPCSLIPERIITYTISYLAKLNKSLKLIGRIGGLKTYRKNKTQSRIRIFVIWECNTTGMMGCGSICWDGGLYRKLDNFVFEDFTVAGAPDAHVQSIIKFFTGYNNSFRKKFPEHTGPVTAPGYKIYRLFQFDIDLWRNKQQLKSIN